MASSHQTGDTRATIGGAKRKQTSRSGGHLSDIASNLERHLPLVRTDAVASSALVDETRRRIHESNSLPEAINIDDGDDDDEAGITEVTVHQAGVRLWNLVLRLSREAESKSSSSDTNAALAYKRLLCHCRVFAFAVIQRSTWSSTVAARRTFSRALHLFDIAIRAAQSCIDAEDVELGRFVLDKASELKPHLEEAIPDDGTNKQSQKVKALVTEYAILRISHLWKEDKLQTADELYSEMDLASLIKSLDCQASEKLAAALLEIGRDLLLKRKSNLATIWLNRAEHILAHPKQSCPPSDSSKSLMISVTYANALAMLDLGTLESHQTAEELIGRLKAHEGDNSPRVQLIQLELLAAPHIETFNAYEYSQVLLCMIKNFHESDSGLQVLHHHIHKLHDKSPSLGCDVLDQLLLSLHLRDTRQWIEKLVVTRVWLLAHQRDAQDGLDAAERVISKLRVPISADTAVAAQTLMWKRIEQSFQEKQYGVVVRWCRLALCHIFEAGGKANRALIERKLLLCSIESGDPDAAKKIYESMCEATQDEPVTKYLLYKLAVKANDLEMAVDSLRSISISTNSTQFLFACVLHAKHMRANTFTVQALKKLASTIRHEDKKSIHLPGLLRCIVLTLRDTVESIWPDTIRDKSTADSELESCAHDLSDVFEGVLEAVEFDRGQDTATEKPQFTADELEWFCRASYNLSLKYSCAWSLESTARILTACVRIIKLLSTGQEAHTATDLVSKTLNCHFLAASALAVVARTVGLESQEKATKIYYAMREHISSFEAGSNVLGQTEADAPSNELSSRLSVLLIFDFEGAICLGDWDDLENICEKAAACRNADTFKVLGDCLFRSQAAMPSQKFVLTMRAIVNKLRAIGTLGKGTLVKYYRCLFQASLYRDNDSAYQVLEEVHGVIQGCQATDDGIWPEDELQFLAATAFNEGIDWFAGGREDRARKWAVLATSMAEQCHDGGKLKNDICDRFRLLKLGDLEIKQSVEGVEAVLSDVDGDNSNQTKPV